MHVDYLVAGQGIAGTLLSYELIRSGASVLVIDDPVTPKASLAAGGLLNPFSARDWTLMNSQAKYLPVALHTYEDMQQLLGLHVVQETAMLVFHENELRKAQFEAAGTRYPGQALREQETNWTSYFNIPYQAGKLQPLHRIDAARLLQGWRAYLSARNLLLEEHLNPQWLSVQADRVHYKDITAGKLIFCEGSTGRDNPLFPGLPFTRNRGEALLLSIPGLPQDYVYYHGIRLVPRSDGLFWCGSNYQWEFTDLQPDKQWREDIIQTLNSWLKLPFQIAEHLVAERPTTAGQQVLCRRHPEFRNIFLFNGLGTRGFSSGPYYVQECMAMLQA